VCALEAGAADARPWGESFPFAFRLEVRFQLCGGVLRVAHTVTNSGAPPAAGAAAAGAAAEAEAPLLPFSIGNHISLRYPFVPARAGAAAAERAAAAWAAGRLIGSPTHELALTEGSLLSGAAIARPELMSAGGVPLSAPCATNGVLSFGAAPPPEAAHALCSLVLAQPGGISVEVSHEVRPPAPAPAAAPGRPGAAAAAVCDWDAVSARRLFVLWGEEPREGGTGQGFICPEPWQVQMQPARCRHPTSHTLTHRAPAFLDPFPLTHRLGGPDSLNTGRGLCVLRGGEACEWAFSVCPSAGVEEGAGAEGVGGQQ